MRIRKVVFENFKSCSQLSVSLNDVNILVGPNNSGKSTIINSFRLLRIAIQRAKNYNPDLIHLSESEQVWGFRFTDRNISISLDSISTNYNKEPSEIRFTLDTNDVLTLLFPEQNECIFYYSRDKFSKLTPAQFRTRFPLNIQVVPVLGPLRKEEELLSAETVRDGLNTHLASFHFRNYWQKNKEAFPEFAALVAQTWPGMTIDPPEFVDGKLRMICVENRISREIYNSGFGFQIWCQLLTHISRGGDSSIVVIDEPEIYLHPDVQRQLIHILKDLGVDFLLATHSVEIIAESEPNDIITLNKADQTAKRLKNIAGVQDAIKGIGSSLNISLTHLLRTKKLVFVESLDDYKIIQRIAKNARLVEVSRGFDLTPIESQGFASSERIKDFAKLLAKAISSDLTVYAIYDRDYYPEEMLDDISGRLRSEGVGVHFHQRKEIENYLIEPKSVSRAVNKQIQEKGLGLPPTTSGDLMLLIDQISNEFESEIQSQYVAKRMKFFEKSKLDQSEIARQAIEIFKKKWQDPSAKLMILPGKKVLARLRDHFTGLGISLTLWKIVDSLSTESIPEDLKALLNELEVFRKEKPAI